MKYYGIIVDLLSRDTDRIEGDHAFKPDVEHGGMFCTCHWFKDYNKALLFQLECEKVFYTMALKGVKGFV